MKQNKNLIIIGIDTSCDDTCIAIIKAKIKNSKLKNLETLSNVVSSQVKLHAKYGGVYPALAKREHQKNLPLVLKKALKEANFPAFNLQFPVLKQSQLQKLKNLKIDFIAVTVGPGLEPCLWQGINFAKDLAKLLNAPIIPINHIEGHIIANFLPKNNFNFQFLISNPKKLFPAICLVVSGGHTQLILMENIGKYKIIGETKDDAAGECLDKTARILGLSYPGGPAIAKIANLHKFLSVNNKSKSSKIINIKLPRPMIYQKNYDFSFSGLKTAVLYKTKSLKLKMKNENYISAMANEIQQAIIDVLIYKTIKAANSFKAKSIILGGGVTANDELKKQFKLQIKNNKLKLNFLVPLKKLCTDNGAMIAATAAFHLNENKPFKKIQANSNLRI